MISAHSNFKLAYRTSGRTLSNNVYNSMIRRFLCYQLMKRTNRIHWQQATTCVIIMRYTLHYQLVFLLFLLLQFSWLHKSHICIIFNFLPPCSAAHKMFATTDKQKNVLFSQNIAKVTEKWIKKNVAIFILKLPEANYFVNIFHSLHGVNRALRWQTQAYIIILTKYINTCMRREWQSKSSGWTRMKHGSNCNVSCSFACVCDVK